MTPREAVQIADETIAYWKHASISANDAWVALGYSRPWVVEWWEVRGQMIRWQLAYASDRTIEKRAA